MSTRYITYRCESHDCRKKFPWDPTDGFPKMCPHCGFEPEAVDDNVIAMPNFLSAKTRAADAVAKKTMDGASERVLLAAQMTGESIADMNNLKLTDMTNDATVKPVSNDVSQFMEQHKVGGFNGVALPSQGAPDPSAHVQQAMQLAAAAHQGPDARAGARAMGSLQKALHGIK